MTICSREGGSGALIWGNLKKSIITTNGRPNQDDSGGTGKTVNASMVLKFGDNLAKGRGAKGS